MDNSEAKDNQPKVPIPELPEPTEGVFDEILAEYMLDPDEYLDKVYNLVKAENHLLDGAIGTPVRPYGDTQLPREFSMKWASIYYDIFSRSAKKAGKTMPTVDIHTYQTVTGPTGVAVAEAWRSNNFEATLNEKLDREEEKFHQRIEDDKLKNPELKKFWDELDVEKKHYATDGVSNNELELDLRNLSQLQLLLQKQNSNNQLANSQS